MSMTPDEFLELRGKTADALVADGRAPGPVYGSRRPVIWHDQRFGSGLTLAGTVDCPTALRAGATQGALDVAIVADMDAPLIVAEGASITLVPLEGDSPDGPFTEAGPSVCITAPAGGMRAEAGDLLARLPVGDRSRPWLKVRLEVTGDIQGTATVGLALLAR